MKKTNHILIFLAAFLLMLMSCQEFDEYPSVPEIEYKGFATLKGYNNSDSLGFLTIGFTDGDGDIGSESNVNFFIDIYQRIDGVMEKIILPDTGVNYNAIIPNLTPDGKYKGIKGDIEIKLELYGMIPLFESDTIAFETYIQDRAKHNSNTIMSPQLILK
jgi:hypothetical protein